MENSNTTMLAVVLIVGLVIGGGIGYFAAPSGTGETVTETVTVEVNPLKDKTVQLGFIVSQAPNLEYTKPYIEQITQVDVNGYCDKLGYGVQFEWLIDSADAQAAVHLEKVQSFKSMGIDIFMGGFWSSQAQAALSYVNENDMLMISASSTSPLLATPDDRLMRTCPTDLVQAPAIGEMLETWGIDAIIVMQRGDSWADGIYNVLGPELDKRNIVEIERIRFAAEVTEFSSYLAVADDLLGDAIAQYGAEHVAILTMVFDELAVIDTQTVDYPNTREIIWFGTESSGRNNRVMDDAGGTQIDLRHFSSLMGPANVWKWQSFSERFDSLTGRISGFYDASEYDGCWVQALSVIETGSEEASVVAGVFPTAASNYYGSTGWLDLDENDDREPTIFDIWGYTDDGLTQSWGIYSGLDIEVTWYDDLLAEAGLIRPSLAEG
jgi:branched-chain amino acid transport system substrate-binding protein